MSVRKRELPDSAEDDDMTYITTFDWHRIHPVSDTISPWELLVSIPFVHLEYMSAYVEREDLIKYAMDEPGAGGRSGPEFVYLMEKALNRHCSQGPWCNIMMPSLCAVRGACWVESFGCQELTYPVPIDPIVMTKPRILELAKFDVVATSRMGGGHFYGCVVVYPKTLDHGYVLCMEPLDRGINSDIIQEFVNMTRNLMMVKYNLPPSSKGAMDKVRPTPDIKMVMVTHAPYMRQTLDDEDGDLACSFWNMLQLTHWIECFGRLCNKDSDEFVRFLDKNLDMRTKTYDLCKVRAVECTVDRVISLESMRYHGLLFLQYLAQYSDLKYIASRMTPAPDMQDLLGKKDECLRMLQRKSRREVFDEYVLAGDSKSVEHYEKLHREYTKQPLQSRRKFLEELPAIDLVRFGIFKLEREMTNQASKDMLALRAMKYDPRRHAPQTYEKRKDEEICTFTEMFDTISKLCMGLKNFSKVHSHSREAAGGVSGTIVVEDTVVNDGGTVIDMVAQEIDGAKQAKGETQIDLSDDA